MIRVYIAIGSNLAQPLQQVIKALEALAALPQTHFIASSRLYRSKPLGAPDQPDYLNAAIALDTELAAEALFIHTQNIEYNQGRIRQGLRFGPRTLDLDIMLYGEQLINSERLTIPHYAMKQREFMLYPLADIAPEIIFPGGKPLSFYLKKLGKSSLTLWPIPKG